jgi:hypothetical protein
VTHVTHVTPTGSRSCAENFSENGRGPAPAIAGLSDDELLAVFPGAVIEMGEELDGEESPCDCGQRTHEWRLRGEAPDVTYTYVSPYTNSTHHDAVEQGREIIPKGKRSGWVVETRPSGHGHSWICALCHLPAAGLGVDYRKASLDAKDARDTSSPLRWRQGYGWRRNDEPDNEPLPTSIERTDEAFLRRIGGPRLVREWQLRARREAERAGEAEA